MLSKNYTTSISLISRLLIIVKLPLSALSRSQIIMITMPEKFTPLMKPILKSEASKPSSGSLWMRQAVPLLDTGYLQNVMSERVSLPCVWHSDISKNFRKTSALLQMDIVHMFWLHNSSCVNTAMILNLTLPK